MHEKNDLSQGKVLPVLIKFTIPIMLSLLLQIAYGTVDLWVAGQFATVGDVSGVTIGSQIMQTITALFMGLSTGATVLIGQYIGRKEPDKATKTVGVSILLFGILALVVTVGLLLTNEWVTALMNTPEDSFSQTVDYLFYSAIGAVFIVFYNLLGSIFRGIGDAKTPLVTVAIACAFNVVLDLVLIAGFGMGAAGAAIATTVAQAMSVVLSVMMIRKRKLPFEFGLRYLSLDGKHIKKILALGIPLAMQSALVSASFLFVTSIINGFGVAASAGVGVCSKIVGIIMIVPNSFTQSLSAFVAQNFGAKQYARTDQGLKYGMLLSLGFGVIMAYFGWFHGEWFTRVFTSDAEVTTAALQYLRSYSIDTILVAVLFSMTGYFNGCGKTTFVMLQAVLSAFFIRVPLAYLFNGLEGATLFTIGLATPASTSLQIIACGIYYWYYQKSFKKSFTFSEI